MWIREDDYPYFVSIIDKPDWLHVAIMNTLRIVNQDPVLRNKLTSLERERLENSYKEEDNYEHIEPVTKSFSARKKGKK